MSTMIHSGKSSAALRVRSLAELTDSDPSTPAAEGVSSLENLRLQENFDLKVRGFPKLVQHRAEPEPDTSLSQLEDLAAELEAALMGDLRNVATSWEPDRSEVAKAAPPAPAALPLIQAEFEEEDPAPEPTIDPSAQPGLPQQDRLAVELLLARGRRPDVAPKPAAAVAAVELEDRLAGELAQRLSIAVDELRVADGEEPTFDAERSDFADATRRRRVLNRQLLGVVALLALVGGGALATIHSVTARTDAPVASELDGLSTAGIVKADAPAALPAPAAKQSYDRAPEDRSLPESPQLRGADMLDAVPGSAPTLSSAMLPGSAVSGQPVMPSVRAAYAAPAAEHPLAAMPAAQAPAEAKPVAIVTDPVDESAPTADPAIAAAEPDVAATDAALPPASDSAAPSAAAAPAKSVAAGSPTPGPARITSGVKLRGNPDNGAPTVGLLKTGDRVQVVQCKGWCEVVVDGKRGFVFKKFLASVSG
ncbi:SH3 domain-containing protein [Kaistia sp. UC242_56]|uniref:SH3 domain-containing protein n=1 Tax=Kaistia sp. UC242_56 TaxID=3374625 RepID=UPI0037B20326